MRPQAAVVALSAQQLEQRFDVFLTHDWGTDGEGRRTHERVAAVHRALKVRPSHTQRQLARPRGTATPGPASRRRPDTRVAPASTSQARGLRSCFDEDRMQGNVVDKMCAGIDDSDVIVVFVTHSYIDKARGQ